MHWAAILMGAAAAVTILIMLAPFVARYMRRLVVDVITATTAELAKEMVAMRIRFEREVGGNGGGLRQAVNELDAKVDGMAKDVSNLSGQFTMHIKVGND